MTNTEEYKWVDITDELEHGEVALVEAGGRAVQYRFGPDAPSTLFTLVDMPSGMKKFVPGRLFCRSSYRVMIDYTADPEYGIGGVWKRAPIVEWTDITRECKPTTKQSTHTTGCYGVLTHRGQEVALFGIDGVKLCSGMSEKYKIEKPKNARVSFSIFVKT